MSGVTFFPVSMLYTFYSKINSNGSHKKLFFVSRTKTKPLCQWCRMMFSAGGVGALQIVDQKPGNCKQWKWKMETEMEGAGCDRKQ